MVALGILFPSVFDQAQSSPLLHVRLLGVYHHDALITAANKTAPGQVEMLKSLVTLFCSYAVKPGKDVCKVINYDSVSIQVLPRAYASV